MLKKEIKQIIGNSTTQGWVLEPDAKSIMKLIGLDVPSSIVTDSIDRATQFLNDLGSSVVIKAVSKEILHKTEVKAVVTGVSTKRDLEMQMKRLLKLPCCNSVLVEEMVDGIEVIVGSKNDYQFGPVIVLGVGGTAVEIYNDTAIRMAPLKSGDALSMAQSLLANQVIFGHRGSAGINMDALSSLMVRFSNLVMDLETRVDSIDMNPVICTKDRCVVADARIILNPNTT